MAKSMNDNFEFAAPKPADSRYLNNMSPWIGSSQVNSSIATGQRYPGLTVNINGTEYWYKDGISNNDLVPKTLSHTYGEPTGSSAITNLVKISESNYDTAEGAGEINPNTVYLITE